MEPNPFLNKRLYVVLCAAACGWFAFTLHHYLPLLTASSFHEAFHTFVGVLRRWGLLDLPLLSAMAVSSLIVGRRFLWTLGIAAEPGAESNWLAMTLGVALYSLAAYAFGAIHLLYPATAWTMVLLPLLGWQSTPRILVAERWSLREKLARWLMLAFIATGLAMVLLSALGPEIEYDPLMIHLAAAQNMAAHHNLAGLPQIPQTFMPRNVTMLFTLGLLLRGETTAKLINFGLGLLTCFGVYVFARRIVRGAGLPAIAILVGSPLILWEMRSPHVDMGFALFVLLAVYCTVVWIDTMSESGDDAWFPLAVFATAFALGTKYQASMPFGALIVVVLWREGLTRAVKFASFSCLGLVPWGIADYIQTRNPFFPLLNGIFKSPYWNAEQERLGVMQLREAGVPVTLHTWYAPVTNLWTLAMDQSGKFRGNIGVLPLLFIPLLLLQRRMSDAMKMLLVFAAVYWTIWNLVGQVSRYFLAAVPVLIVIAACSVVGWIDDVRERVHWTVAAGVATLALLAGALNTPLLEMYGVSSRYGPSITETLPLKYLAGFESRDQYLSRFITDYAAVEELNGIPGKKKVLFWWNAIPIAFYTQGETIGVWSYDYENVSDPDPAKMHAAMLRAGITHIVAGRVGQGGTQIDPESEFVRRFLHQAIRKNGTVVYGLPRYELHQEYVSFDFLNHDAEASPKPIGVGVLSAGDDQRYMMLMFAPSQLDIPANVKPNSVLRFSIGRKFPACQNPGTFELLADGVSIYRREIAAQNPLYEAGWFDEQLDLAPYAGKRVKFTFRVAGQSGQCDWYMWGDPQIVTRPD